MAASPTGVVKRVGGTGVTPAGNNGAGGCVNEDGAGAGPRAAARDGLRLGDGRAHAGV